MTASIPSGFSRFFCEDRCDPAIVALIGHCVENGIDMESELPVSDSLWSSLSECVIPLLSGLRYRDGLVRIKAGTVAVRPDDTGEAVGALLRSDVDSLHSIMRHHGDVALKLTHLVAVGGDPGADTEPWKGLGLAVIPVRTNLEEIAGCDARMFEELFAAFLLERLWYAFVMPQTSEKGGFEDNEKIALLLSGRALQFTVEGLGIRKLDLYDEYVEALADFCATEGVRFSNPCPSIRRYFELNLNSPMLVDHIHPSARGTGLYSMMFLDCMLRRALPMTDTITVSTETSLATTDKLSSNSKAKRESFSDKFCL